MVHSPAAAGRRCRSSGTITSRRRSASVGITARPTGPDDGGQAVGKMPQAPRASSSCSEMALRGLFAIFSPCKRSGHARLATGSRTPNKPQELRPRADGVIHVRRRALRRDRCCAAARVFTGWNLANGVSGSASAYIQLRSQQSRHRCEGPSFPSARAAAAGLARCGSGMQDSMISSTRWRCGRKRRSGWRGACGSGSSTKRRTRRTFHQHVRRSTSERDAHAAGHPRRADVNAPDPARQMTRAWPVEFVIGH